MLNHVPIGASSTKQIVAFGCMTVDRFVPFMSGFETDSAAIVTPDDSIDWQNYVCVKGGCLTKFSANFIQSERSRRMAV